MCNCKVVADFVIFVILGENLILKLIFGILKITSSINLLFTTQQKMTKTKQRKEKVSYNFKLIFVGYFRATNF